MTGSVIEILDSISFGLARIACLGKSPIVTIELDKISAEHFLHQTTKEMEIFLKDYMRPMPIIQLGSVFQYRGVNFRVVERVS